MSTERIRREVQAMVEAARGLRRLSAPLPWKVPMTHDKASMIERTAMIEREFVSVPGGSGRMILRRRDAHLLASGGEIDLDQGFVRGGDPGCTAFPDGTRPLSKAEVRIALERYWL